MKKSFQIRIMGKVQGVFFRRYSKMKAQEIGLIGFVKNRFDGSVMIEVTGDENTIEQFCEWCKQGPPNAKVDSVIINEIPLKDFSSFEIIH